MIKKLLDFLSLGERRRLVLVLISMVVVALLEVIGVLSIMPFIAVLANPDVVHSNPFLSVIFRASNHLGIKTTQQFLFVLGIFVFIFLLAALASKALSTYAQMRFAQMRESSIGLRLMSGYLHQPYGWFLNRHSAELGKTILSEVNLVILNAFVPVMTLIAHGSVVIALLILLFVIDFQLAFTVGVTLTAAYAVIFRLTRASLARMGDSRMKANEARFSIINEAFSAYKLLKTCGLEQTYTHRFMEASHTFASHQAAAQIISQLPRFALEAVAFGGMLLVTLYLMTQTNGLAEALPVVALYAFAGYRLIPALQQVYGALVQLRFIKPALDALHTDFCALQPTAGPHMHSTLSLTNSLTLDGVSFQYPNSARASLKNLCLEIPVGSLVALVGKSGSGKTTLVDVILGLHDIQKGTLLLDGHAITETNKRHLQRLIGYVPQQIYLSDNTVAANIAFGLNESDIDFKLIERSAKLANLHEFVINQLPDGYKTTIGEHGVRLSGGQRQRIGIARALYRNPQLLILDEATSALDTITEQTIMKTLQNLRGELTIIVIAHRLSTVKGCDRIFVMEDGKINENGTYDQLLISSQAFQAMVKNI